MSHPCGVHMKQATAPDGGEIAFVNATRVHKALTAEPEKRLLVWMARRTPATINSDHLTGLGFVCQLLAGAAYALTSRTPWMLWLVDFFLFLNWLGDSLDGTLARVRNQQRPRYGFYVDHMADTLGALALMAGLLCSGYLHWEIAVGMLVCFYLLSIESYLATYTMGRFRLSHGIFGPTEIRLLLVAGNTALLVHPYAHVLGRRFLLFDLAGAVAIAGMALMVLSVTARNTIRLYREETPTRMSNLIRTALLLAVLAGLFPSYTPAQDLDTRISKTAASRETHSVIRTIYVKAEGVQTLAAAKARNVLVNDKCYAVTALEDQADGILSISSEKQGVSSPFTHIPFTGQRIYTSATLFDRKTGEALWTANWSDIWFGSPAKAGEHIVERLEKDRQCQ